ncbi:hypothetical protein [Nostoc sp. TCL26-01]|uniref:hypothetical protein n=1 Tax=Nostoc sp. TCL26-01 TaxID=2576904 RepID=UPI0015BB5503|nr:hypothetical protein [Nostoc sp. TCL26-01]QLE58543.1 hypothetical protein FD725_25375 [Nostoc sp. TCL26-01]
MSKSFTTLLAGIQALSIWGLTTIAMISLPESAQAICAANPMDGVWQNVNPNTRSLVKAEYRSSCHDVILCPNGNCQPQPTDVGKIRLYGSCHPTACDWGWTNVYQQAPWVRGKYNQGFADKWVWARIQNNQLEVITLAQFKDNSGRADYATKDYFQKTSP